MFSFVLLVNDDEKYDIVDCDPEIDAVELKDILGELNRSGGEDISILARRMRKYSMKMAMYQKRYFRHERYSFLQCFLHVFLSFLTDKISFPGRAFKELCTK